MAIFKGKVIMGKDEKYVIDFIGPHSLTGDEPEAERVWRERGNPIYDATLLIENGEASQPKVAPLAKTSKKKNEAKRLRLVRGSRKKVKRNKTTKT